MLPLPDALLLSCSGKMMRVTQLRCCRCHAGCHAACRAQMRVMLRAIVYWFLRLRTVADAPCASSAVRYFAPRATMMPCAMARDV